MTGKDKGDKMGQVIQIDEARIKDHLGEMVRGTVEEALNAMLDAEADQLCGAGRYERNDGRKDTRAGSYDRSLHTKAGEVKLKVPKLRQQTFETAIIERYRRRESSVEEALVEMYLAGVSVRRVEDITELRRQKLPRAAELIEESIGETLTYYAFPDAHWRKIRTNNPLERIMKEIRRRTKVVGAFPDGQSCLNLAAARLRYIAGGKWSTRKYMNMTPLFVEQISTSGAVA